MAIQYVGGQTFFAQTGSVTFNLTGGIASTPATDDLVLISYAEASSGDVSLASAITTSGYTQVAELFANDSNDANLAVFYKVMGATPNTTVSAKTAASSQNGAACVVHVFRGVDTTTPLDVTSTTATNIDTGNTNPAAITPATSGNVIIPFGCYAEGNVARSYTAPSYLSNFRQTNRVGTTYGIVTGSGHVTGQPAGVSYDPATWLASNDSSSYSWCAVTLALRPILPDVSVSVTGVSATGEVGTVTVTAVTGVTVPVTGVTATGELGTVSVAAISNASVSVTGVTATGTVGTVTVSAKATVSPTGVEATGAVGTVTIDFAIHVLVTGVEATGAVGTVQVSADASTTVSGVQGDGTLGSVTVTIGIRANVTGVSATGAVGTAVVVFNTMVFVTGVTAYGRVSSVLVWSNVVPAQTANYASVAPNQNPGYSPINPAQTSVWTPIET